MKRFSAAVLLASGLCLMVGSLPSPAAASASSPSIRSTILPPQVGLGWSPSAWDATMQDVKEAGFSHIVVQHIAMRAQDGGVEVMYPSGVEATTQTVDSAGRPFDVLGTVLPLARKHGLSVRIGLFLDEASWFQDLRPAEDDAHLSMRLAADVWDQYRAYRDVIDGWYLPAEVNVNMIDSPHRARTIDYFDTVVSYLHRHHGRMSVMSSPYFNAYAGQTPQGWTELWRDILDRAPIDIVALQDGTGDAFGAVTRLQIDADLTTWFEATRRGIVQSGSDTELWDNVNLYSRDGSAADLGEVGLNMEAVEPLVSGHTSFGYLSCFAPWAVGTDALHTAFVAWNT